MNALPLCFRVDYQKHGVRHEAYLPLHEVAALMSKNHNLTQEAAVKAVFEKNTRLPARCIYNFQYKSGEPLDQNGQPFPPGPFRVIEYSSGFAVEHIAADEEHWLSDGVDAVTVLVDDEEVTLSPGVMGFTDIWTYFFNSDESTTYEAYFPHLEQEA